MEQTSEEPKKKFISSAFDRILYFLGRRNHSEKEIRQKLKNKFEPEDIERAIVKAKELEVLPHDEKSEQNLAEQFSRALHRKHKGILFIQGYLRQKGLPPIERDLQLEVEKAGQLLKKLKNKSREQTTRFLLSRGYEGEVIGKVLRGKKWTPEEN